MKLSGKILENVINVNSYKYANQAYITEGSNNEVFIQLVDNLKTAEIHPKSEVLPDNPLRYMSQATILTVEAKFPSIDDNSVITVAGTQEFADDKSIWKFELLPSQLPASGSFQIIVTEDGNVKVFNIINAISVELTNIGGC